MSYKPIVLVIMDGVGVSLEKEGNAVALAKLPNLRGINEKYFGTALQAAGLPVGIPWGEVGNSEVGHIAIGSGFVAYQDLPRINIAISNGTFFSNPVWEKAVNHAKNNQSAIHLMGLVSNGGIHSHMDHLFALLKMLSEKKFSGKVFVHAFTDGRDSPPQSAALFLEKLEKQIGKYGIGKIATISGRYYAMDRDKRQERTQLAFEAIARGRGEKAKNPKEAIENSYKKETTDEFIKPTVIGKPETARDGDAVIFFNFRPDRARQLTESFLKSEFKDLLFVSMTQYDKALPTRSVFPPEAVANPLAKIISDAGKTQLHIAETEKYAHVTYFLNGGREEQFSGEERILVPSSKVASYDLKPEMSCFEIRNKLIPKINSKKYDFIAVNFANGDMVGHTGNLEATIKAMEAVDECVGDVARATLKLGGALVITADHGNCERMVNLETGQVDTEHTVNPVPFWLASSNTMLASAKASLEVSGIIVGGILPDVAPTVADLLNLPKPKEMTGGSLIKTIGQQSFPF